MSDFQKWSYDFLRFPQIFLQIFIGLSNIFTDFHGFFLQIFLNHKSCFVLVCFCVTQLQFGGGAGLLDYCQTNNESLFKLIACKNSYVKHPQSKYSLMERIVSNLASFNYLFFQKRKVKNHLRYWTNTRQCTGFIHSANRNPKNTIKIKIGFISLSLSESEPILLQ